MTRQLKVGVAQPVSALGNVDANVAQHAAVVTDLDARVVVFPEMSLTGYSMDAHPIDTTDVRLAPIIDACRTSNAIVLAGAPTLGDDGHRRISMLRIDGTGASIVYSKMYLGGEEPQHYRPGSSPAVLNVDGWRLGLAICKDNGTPEHVAATLSHGIDAYVAGVCETEADRDVQPERARKVIDQHRVGRIRKFRWSHRRWVRQYGGTVDRLAPRHLRRRAAGRSQCWTGDIDNSQPKPTASGAAGQPAVVRRI